VKKKTRPHTTVKKCPRRRAPAPPWVPALVTEPELRRLGGRSLECEELAGIVREALALLRLEDDRATRGEVSAP
jgi:hypothetical protein